MPRLFKTPLVPLAPGIYRNRNGIIEYAPETENSKDASYPPGYCPKDPNHSEENRQHAPHEDGRTEGGKISRGDEEVREGK